MIRRFLPCDAFAHAAWSPVRRLLVLGATSLLALVLIVRTTVEVSAQQGTENGEWRRSWWKGRRSPTGLLRAGYTHPTDRHPH